MQLTHKDPTTRTIKRVNFMPNTKTIDLTETLVPITCKYTGTSLINISLIKTVKKVSANSVGHEFEEAKTVSQINLKEGYKSTKSDSVITVGLSPDDIFEIIGKAVRSIE